MAEAVRAETSLPAECFGYAVSTVDPRWGVSFLKPSTPNCEANGDIILERIGTAWVIKAEGSEFDCGAGVVPDRVLKDLVGRCLVVRDRFVTPSRNIACLYRSDTGPDGSLYRSEVWCYVKSSRTLAIVVRNGLTRPAGVYIKRRVAEPGAMRSISYPALRYGKTWAAPDARGFTCVSRRTSLLCKVVGHAHWYGFTATRRSVKRVP